MILTCPECTTRFLLPAEALGASGRKVRCSNCQHIWYQEPEEGAGGEEEQIPEDGEARDVGIEDIPDAIRPSAEKDAGPDILTRKRMPAVRSREKDSENLFQRQPKLLGYASAALFFVILTSGLYFARQSVYEAWPPSAALFKLAAADIEVAGEGLVFDRIQAAIRPDGHIDISGNIINLRRSEQFVPVIAAELRDEGGDILAHWHIRTEFSAIEPEGAEFFSFISGPGSGGGTVCRQSALYHGIGWSGSQDSKPF